MNNSKEKAVEESGEAAEKRQEMLTSPASDQGSNEKAAEDSGESAEKRQEMITSPASDQDSNEKTAEDSGKSAEKQQEKHTSSTSDHDSNEKTAEDSGESAERRQEMLTSLTFDQGFKTTVREFYCYGFKSLEQMAPVSKEEDDKEEDDKEEGSEKENGEKEEGEEEDSEEEDGEEEDSEEESGEEKGAKEEGSKHEPTAKYTIRDNRLRLNKILNLNQQGQKIENDYLMWTPDDKQKNDIIYTMIDSVELPTNPFLNVYRFCNCKMFPDYVQIIALLSPDIHQVWRGPLDEPKYVLKSGTLKLKEGSLKNLRDQILKFYEEISEELKDTERSELEEPESSESEDPEGSESEGPEGSESEGPEGSKSEGTESSKSEGPKILELKDEEIAELIREASNNLKEHFPELKKESPTKKDLDELKKKYPRVKEDELAELLNAECTERELRSVIEEELIKLNQKLKRESSKEKLPNPTENKLPAELPELTDEEVTKLEEDELSNLIEEDLKKLNLALTQKLSQEITKEELAELTEKTLAFVKVVINTGVIQPAYQVEDYVKTYYWEKTLNSLRKIGLPKKVKKNQLLSETRQTLDEVKQSRGLQTSEILKLDSVELTRKSEKEKQKDCEKEIESEKVKELKNEKNEKKMAMKGWIQALLNNNLNSDCYEPTVVRHNIHNWEGEQKLYIEFYNKHGRKKEDQSDLDKARRVKDDRLKELKSLGILRCKRKTDKSDKYWLLNDVTISEILQAGREANSNFENHFISTLDFYSRYYFLGEVGMFMLDRLLPSGSTDQTYKSPFRFKQDYFIQPLNDFDLLDLLWAIESDRWCLIEYRHAFADKRAGNVQFLCFPLEIRISSSNGREYLMYYDPIKRMCMSLRLDFICNITFYSDETVKFVLEKAVKPKYRISAGEIDAEIKRSQEILRHIWGVSTGAEGHLEGNAAAEKKPVLVKLRFKFDSEKEPYIEDRLWREGRNGVLREVKNNGSRKTMEYRVRVYDPEEVYAWAESFTGWDISPYRPYGEWNNTVPRKDRSRKNTEKSEQKKEKAQPRENCAKSNYKKWNVPDDIKKALKGKEETVEPKPHELIFNGIFNTYGQIFASIFTSHMLSSESWENASNWNIAYWNWGDEIIKKSTILGDDTNLLWSKVISPDKIKEKFLFEDTNGQKLKCKYQWKVADSERGKKNLSFYKDILPLSGIEVRWLKTILKADDKIKCFLTDEEIEAIENVLDKREEPGLPTDKIIYYDCCKFPADRRKDEEVRIKDFLKVLSKQKKAEITFMAIPDNSISTKTCVPLRILFSKRDNFFTLCFWSCDDQKIYFVNASRVIRIQEENEKKDDAEWTEAENALSKYYKDETRNVKVRFNGNQNVPDRILMELAPWGKKCTLLSHFDRAIAKTTPLASSASDNYELQITYLPDEKYSLVDQLIGFTYGENVLTFKDQKNEIARLVKKRKKKQTDRTGKPEPGKNRQLEKEQLP